MSDVTVHVDVAALFAAAATFNLALAQAGDPRAAAPTVGGVPGPGGGTPLALGELLARAASATSAYIERFQDATAAAIGAAADAGVADTWVAGR